VEKTGNPRWKQGGKYNFPTGPNPGLLVLPNRHRAFSGATDTGSRQSLDSALGVLQECCFESGRTWQAQELLAELDRITGTSVFTDLYREHVMDDQFPDVEYTFEQLGLVLRSDSIRFDPDAPWGRIRYYIMKG
jgi:hypothetical protein